jgi:hypothetical protein
MTTTATPTTDNPTRTDPTRTDPARRHQAGSGAPAPTPTTDTRPAGTAPGQRPQRAACRSTTPGRTPPIDQLPLQYWAVSR